jgi:hypothetical protein
MTKRTNTLRGQLGIYDYFQNDKIHFNLFIITLGLFTDFMSRPSSLLLPATPS